MARPNKRVLALLIALGLPLAAVGALAVVARPEASSVLVPILGPWAGLAYGHHDCTMGTQFPLASLAWLAIGLAIGFASGLESRRARATRGFSLLLALVALWALGWEFAAFASLANASS